MNRNPPSNDFKYLNEGMFAKAFRKDKIVELVISRKSSNDTLFELGVIDFPNQYLYDMSREILIESRSVLPNDLKKYLPEIRRKRLDIDRKGNIEFVYEMPLYKKYDCDVVTEPTPQEKAKIRSVIEDKLDDLFFNLESSSGYTESLWLGDDENIGLAAIDGNFDENEDNLAMDENNNIIYLDPCFCCVFEIDAIRMFAPLFPNFR